MAASTLAGSCDGRPVNPEISGIESPRTSSVGRTPGVNESFSFEAKNEVAVGFVEKSACCATLAWSLHMLWELLRSVTINQGAYVLPKDDLGSLKSDSGSYNDIALSLNAEINERPLKHSSEYLLETSDHFVGEQASRDDTEIKTKFQINKKKTISDPTNSTTEIAENGSIDFNCNSDILVNFREPISKICPNKLQLLSENSTDSIVQLPGVGNESLYNNDESDSDTLVGSLKSARISSFDLDGCSTLEDFDLVMKRKSDIDFEGIRTESNKLSLLDESISVPLRASRRIKVQGSIKLSARGSDRLSKVSEKDDFSNLASSSNRLIQIDYSSRQISILRDNIDTINTDGGSSIRKRIQSVLIPYEAITSLNKPYCRSSNHFTSPAKPCELLIG